MLLRRAVVPSGGRPPEQPTRLRERPQGRRQRLWGKGLRRGSRNRRRRRAAKVRTIRVRAIRVRAIRALLQQRRRLRLMALQGRCAQRRGRLHSRTAGAQLRGLPGCRDRRTRAPQPLHPRRMQRRQRAGLAKALMRMGQGPHRPPADMLRRRRRRPKPKGQARSPWRLPRPRQWRAVNQRPRTVPGSRPPFQPGHGLFRPLPRRPRARQDLCHRQRRRQARETGRCCRRCLRQSPCMYPSRCPRPPRPHLPCRSHAKHHQSDPRQGLLGFSGGTTELRSALWRPSSFRRSFRSSIWHFWRATSLHQACPFLSGRKNSSPLLTC